MLVTFGSARPGQHRAALRECWICWELDALRSQAKSKEQTRWQAQLAACTPGPTCCASSAQGLLTIVPEPPVLWSWLSDSSQSQPAGVGGGIHPQKVLCSATAGNQKPSHLLIDSAKVHRAVMRSRHRAQCWVQMGAQARCAPGLIELTFWEYT